MKYLKRRVKQIAFLLIIVALAFSVISGCASQYKVMTDVEEWDKITDKQIMEYTSELKKMLGKEAANLRIIRKISSSIGIITGAIATTIHGAVSADADTITMFSGVATLTPMMQKIWGAGEASQARQKGIGMISKAQSKYLISVGGGTGKVDSTIITSEGATLFNEVNAALIVISDAVAQRIPSLQDLQTAEGIHPQ